MGIGSCSRADGSWKPHSVVTTLRSARRETEAQRGSVECTEGTRGQRLLHHRQTGTEPTPECPEPQAHGAQLLRLFRPDAGLHTAGKLWGAFKSETPRPENVLRHGWVGRGGGAVGPLEEGDLVASARKDPRQPQANPRRAHICLDLARATGCKGNQ